MAPVAITPGYTHSVAPCKPTINGTSIGKIDYAGLEAVANQLVQPGRGIYASDETPEGLAARFNVFDGNLPEDEQSKKELRRSWRECLYTAGEDLSSTISGVIMFSETLTSLNDVSGTRSLSSLLTSRGIIPGVRVDLDQQPLSWHSPLEPVTQGHDDLLERCKTFRQLGARFTKWRAPFLLNQAGTLPSKEAVERQCQGLARFAVLSQYAGLVPIVEPDVGFDGDASLETSIRVHTDIVSCLYRELVKSGVHLEGTLLKPSLCIPGVNHPSHSTTTSDQIAQATLTYLSRSVPPSVPGIVFLSGGVSDSQIVNYLNSMNRIKNENDTRRKYPWSLTFSFGRALQGKAMELYAKGEKGKAQDAFLERAKWCSEASLGRLREGEVGV